MASKNINPKKVDGSALPTSNSGLGSDDLWQDNGSVRVGTSTPTSFLNISTADLTQTDQYRKYTLEGSNPSYLEFKAGSGSDAIRFTDGLDLVFQTNSSDPITTFLTKIDNSGIRFGSDNFRIRHNGPSQFYIQGNSPYNGKFLLGTGVTLQAPDANRKIILAGHSIDFMERGLGSTWGRVDNVGAFIWGSTTKIGSEGFSVQKDTLIKGSDNSSSTSGFKVTDVNNVTRFDVRNNGDVYLGSTLLSPVSNNISNANLTFDGTHYVDLNSNEWSIKNGSDSYFNIKSTGEFVIGKGAQNLSTSSQKYKNTIIGYDAETTPSNVYATVSVGNNATTSNNFAVAIGNNAISSGASSISILGNATKSDSIAIGKNTNATGNFRSIAIGTNSSATYNQTVAIGSTAQATHNYAQAFGTGANATKNEALAVGYLSKSSAIRGIAIGTNNEVVLNHNNSIVIGGGVSNAAGNQLSSTAANQFVVGFNSISPTILIGATTDSYIKSTGTLSLETNTTVKGSDNSASTTGFKVTDINDDSLLEVKNTGEVVIGTTSSNDSAKLQVDSTTQGFAGPRMTTTERNNISTPIAGLEVYDTTLNSKMIYNGTSWDSLLPTSGGSGTKVLVKGAMGANQTANNTTPIVEFVTTGTPAGGSLNVNGEWDNTNHKFTVGASGAGTYLIQSQLFLNNGTGWSTLYLYKNGSIYSSFGGNGTDTTNTWDNLDGTIAIDLVVGDYIDIRAYSSSNGTISFSSWPTRQAFSITKVSAVAPAAGTDVNALHTNISNEINSLTEKTDPSNTDSILIEESAGTKKSQSRKNFKRPIVSTTTTLSSLTPLVDDIEAYVLTSLSSNITINAPTGTPYDFQNLWFRITDNGTSRTITKNAIFVDYTGNFPTSTTINKQLIFASQWDGSNWNILAWKIQP